MFPITWNEIAPYLYTECKISRKRNDVPSRFNKVARYFEDKEFNRMNVMGMFDELQSEGYRHSTLNNLLGIVKHCTAFLVYAERAQKDFMDNFSYYEKQACMLDVLTDEEVARLIDVRLPRSRDADYINDKYALIIEILSIYTLRISELANIEWDRGYNGAEFIIFEGKTFSASRKLEVLPYLIPRINKLRRYDHKFVFGGPKGKLLDATINEELKSRCKACGITKSIAAHSLRRSSITNYIEKNIDWMKLLKITGHKDANSLNRYNHLAFRAVTGVLESSHMATRHWTIDRLKKKYREYLGMMKEAPCNQYLVQGQKFVVLMGSECADALPMYLREALEKARKDSSIELMDESIHYPNNL